MHGGGWMKCTRKETIGQINIKIQKNRFIERLTHAEVNKRLNTQHVEANH